MKDDSVIFRLLEKQEDGTFKVVGEEIHCINLDDTNIRVCHKRKGLGACHDITRYPEYYIDHDRKDRYIGVKYPAGQRVFERDEMLIEHDGVEYGKHTVVYCADVDRPAFDLEPPFDCDCNAIQYLIIEGKMTFTGIQGVTNARDRKDK